MVEEQLLYRYRTLKHIFEFKELEKQEIYFASPEELNDPMEYYQNIIFQGDEVVWKNLFKHYFAYIFFNLIELKLSQNKELLFKKNKHFIHFNGSFQDYPFLKKLFYSAYNEFYNTLNLDYKIFENKKISYNKLINILRILNELISVIIINHIVSTNYKIDNNRLTKLLQLLKNSPNNENIIIDDEYRQIITLQDMIYNYIGNKIDVDNFILYFICNNYVHDLKKLIFDNIYIASFTTNFNNSYMWSIYAEKNSGICLIYNINIHNNLYNDIYGKKTLPLFKTLYGEKHNEVNFFNHIALTIYDDYNQFWYYDSISKKQSIFFHKKTLKKYEHISKARKQIEQHMIDIHKDFIIKTEDWKHEQEYRILLTNQEERKLQYNFHDLYGIIFGIGTPYEAKQKIVKIILDKCKENKINTNDFHFYQAYFNPETNQIEKYEIEDISIYTPHGA